MRARTGRRMPSKKKLGDYLQADELAAIISKFCYKSFVPSSAIVAKEWLNGYI